MTYSPNLVRLWITRGIVYVLLGVCAFLMLFPFIYMLFTSVKLSNDVYNTPPRLFPRSPITREYNGEKMPVYRTTINGEKHDLVLTDEKVKGGRFTTADKIDADNPTGSASLLDLPLDDPRVAATDEVVTLINSKGESKEFPVYDVTYEGKTRHLALAYTPKLNKFVDPGDSSVYTYALISEFAGPPELNSIDFAEKVEFQWGNYNAVLTLRNLDRSLVNTMLVTLGVTLGQIVTSVFGGYAFSRTHFRGRDALFIIYLGSIMIPFAVLIVPMYRLMVAIGWQNRLVSLIVPWIFTAYGTFMMRQFFLTIPKEIEEAALLDGCSRIRILWRIFVPLSTPAIATQVIFTFLYAWNSFLWPFIIINLGNTKDHVLTLSLITLGNLYRTEPNLVMTGAAITILPPMIIFILAQKYFIEGVATSGLKG